MPQFDFTQPMTLQKALEQYALAFHCAMIALRNEANFHEDGDHAVLNAAQLFCSMLEDAYPEAVELTNKLERRVLGMIGN